MAETASAGQSRAKVNRRTFLVDRSFQVKYTMYLVIVGAAISLLFGAMMYQAHVETTLLVDRPELREAIKSHDSTLRWMVVVIAVVMAMALGLFGILVTHRVAGPIYVFSHYLAVLGQGRYPLLRPLRRRDELKSFYEVFHRAVTSMRERDKTEGQVLTELARILEATAAKIPDAAETLGPAAGKLRVIGQRMLEAAASQDAATPGQIAEAVIPVATVKPG